MERADSWDGGEAILQLQMDGRSGSCTIKLIDSRAAVYNSRQSLGYHCFYKSGIVNL
jgi:hypothetical protein